MPVSARILSPILLFVTGLAFAETPEALLDRAKKVLKTPGHRAQAVALLRQANEQWKAANDTSPAYADSLDLFAVLAQKEAPDDARTAAAAAVPLRALLPDHLELLALAYEVQADTIGRPDPAAESAWQKGFVIRQQLVRSIASEAAVPPLSVERLGPGISNPSLTAKQEPSYTNYAVYRQVQGSVALAIVISAEGIPTQFQLVRGLGYGLDEAAAQAVKKWRFRPAVRAGVPVAVHAKIEMNFRLLHNAPLP